MQGFIAELRRRNVLRAAAFYAAAGWLLVQVATQVFPFFDISNSVVRSVVLLIAAGFVPAMLFSWFYELTPSGIHRESELRRDASIARGSGRVIDRSIIAVLALAVALLLFDRLRPRHAEEPAPMADKSIAVLPFDNLSDDKSNAYFAAGIQDEILTKLARIGELRVIARSSTQQYTAQPGNLAEVAHQLGVANILEGSVQKSGDTVHINVQLIRAASNDHLWADSYDRKLDNIFAVEGEVAQSIAQALQARLSGGEAQTMQAPPTANADAYDAYLRGLSYETRVYNGSALEPLHNAEDAYAEALRLDPDFALAWAHLSVVKSYAFFNGLGPTATLPDEIRHSAETAVRLRPDLGEAYLAQGYYRYRVQRDYEGGLESFHRALQLLPNNPDVLASIAYIERRQGKWQESTAHLETATRQDPRNTGMLAGLAQNYLNLRQYPQALAVYDKALAVLPGDADLIAGKAQVYLDSGQYQAADQLMQPLPLSQDNEAVYEVKLTSLLRQHRYPELIDAIRGEAATRSPQAGETRAVVSGLLLGQALRVSGQAEAARAPCAEALEHLKRLGVNDQDDSRRLKIYAELEACSGDQAAALRDAQRAVDLGARDAFARGDLEIGLASVLVWCGQNDKALQLLPRLLQEPGGISRADLRDNPTWDPLRADPRFAALLAGG